MATTKIRSSNQLFIDAELNMGMTGSDLKIINLADPVDPKDAVNKAYVDAIQMGLDIKESVKVATTTNLSGTTNPAFTTLTNASLPRASIVIDGISGLTVGSRVLIKNQIDKSQNGIYTITDTGSTTTDWVLTRASDFDNTPGVEVTAGAFTFVEEGLVNEDSGWVLTTNGTIIIGVTPLTFVQFSGAGQIEAGWGIVKSGNTLSVNQTLMDSYYVNVTGDTMTGTLTSTGFIKNGGTADQYLMANGTVTTTGNTTSYYDSRYVNVTGDTMTGQLYVDGNFQVSGNTTFYGDITMYNGSLGDNVDNIPSAYISTIYTTASHYNSVPTNFIVLEDVDGGFLSYRTKDDVLTDIGAQPAGSYVYTSGDTMTGTLTSTGFIKNGGTADQYLMADGSVTTTGNTVSMFDGRYVNVTGDTMTGSLNVTGVSQLIEYSYVGINVVTGSTIVNSISLSPSSVEINNTLQTVNIDVYSQNNNYNTLLSTSNVDGNFTITPFDNAQLVVIGTGGIKTNQLYVGSSGAEFSVFEDGSFQSESSGTMNSLSIVNGVVTASISSSGTINGTSFVKSGGTNSEFLMANGVVSKRKYRKTTMYSTGTTVCFSFSDINGGNITIDSATFEFFKNGILMNDNGNDYNIVFVDNGSKQIRVTVTDDIISGSGSYDDVFLANFNYSY